MEKFNITNAGDVTKLYILSDIGGWDGIQASELIPAIHEIKSERIEMHVNSMGGDVFQATGIFNALANHKAYKVGYVDGIAASAASYLIQVCDEIEMGKGTQLMIHDAMGVYQGNASGIKDFEALLNDTSNDIAAFYAARAGGTTADWRKKMKAETWYTAEEAVAAKLADRVAGSVMSAANRIDMRLQLINRAEFKYKGRENAPTPELDIADKNNVITTEPFLQKDALMNILSILNVEEK